MSGSVSNKDRCPEGMERPLRIDTLKYELLPTLGCRLPYTGTRFYFLGITHHPVSFPSFFSHFPNGLSVSHLHRESLNCLNQFDTLYFHFNSVQNNFNFSFDLFLLRPMGY